MKILIRKSELEHFAKQNLSLQDIVKKYKDQGITISENTVRKGLKQFNIKLEGKRKTIEFIDDTNQTNI